LKKGGGVFPVLSRRRVGDGLRATESWTDLAALWAASWTPCAALWMEDDAFEKRLSIEPRSPEDGVPSRDMVYAAG
jgi:hypothetical protein